tara:strand:+ start:157 stop:264 length:108 start_codon:yes stop_codon:yes gene_type:complete
VKKQAADGYYRLQNVVVGNTAVASIVGGGIIVGSA